MNSRDDREGDNSPPRGDSEEELNQGDEEQQDASECNITSEDLDQIANLVDTIKEIYAEVDEENLKTISAEIDNNVQAIMLDLGNKLTPDLSQEVASVYNLNAKFAFYNVCFGKAHEILNKVDPKLASVFNTIQETNVFVVSRFTDKLLTLHPTISDLIQRLEEVEQERPAAATAKDDSKVSHQQIASLQDQLQSAFDSIAKKDKEIERLKREFKEVQKESKDNHKDSPGYKNSTHHDKKHTNPTPTAPEFEVNEDYKEKREERKRPTAAKSGVSSRNVPHIEFHEEQNKQFEGPCVINWIDMGQNIGKTNRRIVTLRQAKDLIEEISQSKRKLDAKCLESPIPRETMEQHMYNYLSQKFGLRNLVVEWATALVNCLKIYWAKDNDCAVFAMILRNECDEEFRNIQKQVKSTIQDLFMIAMKARLPTKKNSEIQKMLDEKFRGNISQEECVEILRYIYKDEDFNDIKGRVDRAIVVTEVKTGPG
jgi:hypothetical protein